ncbi:TonB-dependent receptor plug domain-containing protein [Mucilaginibacter sp.]|uniref:TonB-dependent receptor plug domain-containing protein n=1 Tax=Mucilaginibacter sp. TaxID=1882438 RepID=UPI00261D7F2C|nr:TonB-dependent receptor plug domain-containing protein [Mucilaginibacter sp.]MDB5030389.1 TonB-dependent receptor [Mucilaginibacter sp.]
MKKLFFILLAFTCFCVKAQEKPATTPAAEKLKTIAASLNEYSNKAYVEKVHIQFDKPFYSLGDTIWMKAYVVNGSNELSPLSKVLHIDIVNDKGIVKTTGTVPVTKGLGWGAIILGDSLLQAGNYHIRAYTNWMRNMGSEYFFDKAVKIGNALSSARTTVADNNTQGIKGQDISVSFFPEGGDLVTGLTSKVAFKALGTDGLSREISGYVVDRNNKQVTTLQSEHAGMGTFMLQPTPANTYTAIIKYNGAEKRIALPKAKDSGYVLTVTQNDNNIAVSVSAGSNLGSIAFVAQANNIVQYAATKTVERNAFTTLIPKSRFPEGIVQLTLFSPDYQPVAERLVFVHHPYSYLTVNLGADKTGYKKREKVHLNLNVTDDNGRPVTAAFSLAVTDETKVPFDEVDEKTIFSNLLLTSDLKGYVEQPNYYFTAITTDKTNQLDNLLLTQGWRRFAWKDILSHTPPPLTHQAQTGVGISGRVTKGGKPVPGAKVFVLFNVGSGILYDTVANSDGRFTFTNFPFAKGTSYNVSAVDTKGNKNFKIDIDKQNYELPAIDNLPYEQPANNNFLTYIENSKARFEGLLKEKTPDNAIMLQEVNIKEIAVKNSSSLAGPGNADQVLTFIDLLGCQYDLSKCLEGRLTNIRFKPDSAGTPGAGMTPYSRGFDTPMTIIVDGIERPDGLTSIMSADVSSVEVLRGGGASALYGLHGANGVIIVTLKKGDINYSAYETTRQHGYDKADGLKNYTFNGYDMRRQFYSPDYTQPANKQVPDLRSTIYWKPNIITTYQGKASVDFFNADGTGNYRVVVEGLGPDGKMGRQVYHYAVK